MQGVIARLELLILYNWTTRKLIEHKGRGTPNESNSWVEKKVGVNKSTTNAATDKRSINNNSYSQLANQKFLSKKLALPENIS